MWNSSRMPESLRSLRSAWAPLALVAFGVGYVFIIGGASGRIMQSFHGLHHSAYVYQILQGIIPPTNPSSLEAPANFYWIWHAWLALGVLSFDITPFEMSLVSNGLGLSGFLCAIWLATGEYTQNKWLRLAVCGVPFFILNPLGLVQFATRLAVVWLPEIFRTEISVGLFEHLLLIARHHSSLQLVDHNLVQLFPRLGLFEAAALSDRAGHLINKFLNFNSFPLALGFFALGQWLLLHVRGRVRLRAVMLGVVSFCMAVTSPLPAIAFGLTVAAYLLVEGLPLLAAYRESEDSLDRARLGSLCALVVGCGIGVLLALPLLIPVASAYQGRALVVTPGSGLLAHAVSLGWALVPVFVLLGFAGIRRRRLAPSARVHALSALLYGVVALTLVVPVEDPNEYKFVLLAAHPSALLLLALWSTQASPDETRIRAVGQSAAVATGGLLLMGALSFSVMALIYIASPWSASEPFVLRGTTTEIRPNDDPKHRDLDAAYGWLRTSTPGTAYVFAAAVGKDDARLPVIAQRRVVVQLASPFTRAISHQAALLAANRELLRSLAACELGAPALEVLRAVPVRWPDELYALIEIRPGSRNCDDKLTSGFELGYSNPSYAVYRVRSF